MVPLPSSLPSPAASYGNAVNQLSKLTRSIVGGSCERTAAGTDAACCADLITRTAVEALSAKNNEPTVAARRFAWLMVTL